MSPYIKITSNGNYSKLNRYLERLKEVVKLGVLDKYGRRGVQALSEATPVDSGKTAESWEYKILHEKDKSSISFYNTNINDGVNIAIILQYGHGTNNGGYVRGRDYINPAIQPIFDEIVKEAWLEVTSL